MPLTDKDIVDFILNCLISLLTISWCFLLFAWFKPEKAVYFAAMFSQTKSMRKKLSPIEKPIVTERIIYKHHIPYGILIVALSSYIIYNLNNGLEAQLIVNFINHRELPVIIEIIFESFIMILWIGSVFSFFIGIIVVVRPSLLKRLEAKSNIWFSTRSAMKGLEKKYSTVDIYFVENTKKIVLPLLVICTILIGVLVYTLVTIKV